MAASFWRVVPHADRAGRRLCGNQAFGLTDLNFAENLTR